MLNQEETRCVKEETRCVRSINTAARRANARIGSQDGKVVKGRAAEAVLSLKTEEEGKDVIAMGGLHV